MSIDIYAAKLVRSDEGDDVWEPVLPFNHSDRHVLHPDCDSQDCDSPDYDGDPFIPNPDYIPGVAMNMSGSNWMELCRKLGMNGATADELPLEEIRKNVLDALAEGLHWGVSSEDALYLTQRAIQLLNVCELGIARGAERLCVVEVR